MYELVPSKTMREYLAFDMPVGSIVKEVTTGTYAEIKRCKEWQTRNLNEAMKPEDIMF